MGQLLLHRCCCGLYFDKFESLSLPSLSSSMTTVSSGNGGTGCAYRMVGLVGTGKDAVVPTMGVWAASEVPWKLALMCVHTLVYALTNWAKVCVSTPGSRACSTGVGVRVRVGRLLLLPWCWHQCWWQNMKSYKSWHGSMHRPLHTCSSFGPRCGHTSLKDLQHKCGGGSEGGWAATATAVVLLVVVVRAAS